MSSLTPSIARLKSLLTLEERHAALLQQADELHQEISTMRRQLFDGLTSTAVKSIGRAVRKTKAPRGALKEKIVAALETAGSAGLKVTELASTLETKAANLHAWFHSTGKSVPGITKIGGGHYRLHSGASKAPAAAPAKAPKASKKKPGRPKADGSKRGSLSEKILTYLKEAGSEGITIKDIADKADTNYRNVAVWFATTGKKFPKIKKVRPATYRLAA